MNEEIDLEQMLSRSTPLPCSVDSMELMFAAGVEQQKKQAKGQRTWTICVSVTSCFFLMTTLSLSYWLLNLRQENENLIAELSESRSRQIDVGQSYVLTQNEVGSETNEVVSDSDSSNEERGSFPEMWVSGQTNDSEYGQTPSKNYWLRGVSLRPEDEYRNPVESYGVQTSSPGFGSEVGSANSNLKLRNQLQGVFLGL